MGHVWELIPVVSGLPIHLHANSSKHKQVSSQEQTPIWQDTEMPNDQQATSKESVDLLPANTAPRRNVPWRQQEPMGELHTNPLGEPAIRWNCSDKATLAIIPLPSSCRFSFLKSFTRSSNLTWEARKKSCGSGSGKTLLSVPAS